MPDPQPHSALSTAELVGLILGVPVADCEASRIAASSCAELAAVYGTEKRAEKVLAAIELGRRSVGERPQRGRRLAAAADVWQHFRARLMYATVEEFWVVALDVRHRVMWERMLSRGTLTGVDVHPREVFAPLIEGRAAAAICLHNHPSGDPTPSRQDLDLTARLRSTGELCGIVLLDHVVVAAEGYCSIADRGWL